MQLKTPQGDQIRDNYPKACEPGAAAHVYYPVIPALRQGDEEYSYPELHRDTGSPISNRREKRQGVPRQHSTSTDTAEWLQHSEESWKTWWEQLYKANGGGGTPSIYKLNLPLCSMYLKLLNWSGGNVISLTSKRLCIYWVPKLVESLFVLDRAYVAQASRGLSVHWGWSWSWSWEYSPGDPGAHYTSSTAIKPSDKGAAMGRVTQVNRTSGFSSGQ